VTAVRDILELAYGKALKESDRDGGNVPVVGSGGVVGGHSTGITDAPTIVVGRKGSIGSVTWIDGPAWPIDTAYFVKPRREDLDRRWAYWMLRSLRMETMNKSAAVPGLNRDDVYRLEVSLPPLPEQRRIAAILDHADALRAKRRQLLAHIDALGSAAFVERFGSHAELLALGESLTFVTSGGRGWAKYYSDEGERFIQSLDVQMGSISARDPVFVVPPDNAEARRTRTAVGDVLLTITGSRIGRVAALPAALAGSFVSQHVAILRADPQVMLPEFLAAMLALPSLGQHLIAGAQYGQTKPGLNFEQIRGFSLPRPPLPEQRRFVNHLHMIASQRVAMTHAETSIGELLASLQSRAFRGEL
jgi:type I restriction enzyme S subunit